jgi:hypothetical protein
MHKVLVGADPELFMRNPNSGEFVSAHGKVPGTKYEPFKVPNGAIQIDGTALEFNIDPASTVHEFIQNIKSVRATLESYVPGFNVVAEPVANYNPDYWLYEVPPEAQTLGCDPDFNGWTMEQNPRPEPGSKPFRTASGHVHIGWTNDQDVFDKEHYLECCKMARQMDYYLGIHSLIWDKDGTRRSLYGKAGAFRPKPYGVEYRVLSNRWLESEDLMAWVYNAVQAGMKAAFEDNWAEAKYGKLAQHIIDNNVTDWHTVFPNIEFPNLDLVP